MFGGPVDPPNKPKLKPQRNLEHQDILIPSIHSGKYGHYARRPNTDYQTKLLHYKQRSTSLENEAKQAENKRLVDECYKMTFQKLSDQKHFHLEIRTRVNQKLKEYDDQLNERRERLRKLLADDEREFIKETVDNMQKGDQVKYEEAKRKVKQLETEKEARRLKLVEEKRIQQYADRCEALRPVLDKKHLLESKIIQQQQMRENEARRSSEKESDYFWDEIMKKNLAARLDREQQDAIDEHNRKQVNKEALAIQIRGKELAKLEEERTKMEDRLEVEKLAEQIRREHIEAVEKKRKGKTKMAEELRQQVILQEKFLAAREKEEKELNEALIYLSQIEYEREMAKFKNTTLVGKREMLQYRQHLKILERERKEDEIRLSELLEEHRKMIERKQDDAKCKVQEAKEKLLKDVLDGRAEQIAWKKQEAEQQLRMKEAENELNRLCYDTNKKLYDESARLKKLAAEEYRDDLCKQIEYNNELKEREQEALERQLEQGKQEEEKYRKIVDDILSREHDLGDKHPFRTVLEKYDCNCPKLNPKY